MSKEREALYEHLLKHGGEIIDEAEGEFKEAAERALEALKADYPAIAGEADFAAMAKSNAELHRAVGALLWMFEDGRVPEAMALKGHNWLVDLHKLQGHTPKF